jgi:peroxiredoxin Q/BCP
MEAYRDQYASVFRGGVGVTVIGLSNDPVEELASWAADSDFPVLFGSDANSDAAEAYGIGKRDNGMPASRAVVVIGPDGRVAWATTRFREIDPTAYEELAAAVAEVAPPLDQDQAQQ